MEQVTVPGKYQPYPEYKDSGVEWLGGIPEHWSSTQIKNGFDITLGKMLTKEPKDSSYALKHYLKAINIQPEGINISNVEEMWFSPSEIKSLRLKRNDVLISEGGDVGRSAIWNNELPECYIQNAINRARALKSSSPNYLYYWMLFLKQSGYIEILCNKATIAHYTAEKVEASPLLLPIKEEQRTIAAFLDYETARIDKLIAQQQRLIELLKEKRQAVISHAVTKGLNPDAPMKDSGVEWLGEVPEHWDVKRLKHFGKVVGGFAFKSSDFVDAGYPVIKISNVSHISFDWSDASFLPEEFSSAHKEYIAPRGALIFAMTRPVIAGGIKVAQIEGHDDLPLVNQRVGFMSIKSEDMAKFVLMSTQSSPFLSQFVNNMTITNQPNISSEGIESIYIPVPPEEEMLSILEHLVCWAAYFEDITSKSILQVSLLQERRTALISAAVTGKIDLRGWTAPSEEVAV
ncbi:restriction endonuclease subunit S [Raoultella ornithinolytica]|uniref:restriction endonuclease subunit S n=2 Tax=Enterobacteriaceae TaxID=543 RepID=UPI001AF361DC|nr:restriction endonuclease subunit S [Raoultella ornithinolytica]QQO51830.1 restriction endonuclease subunit S [Raoultella ornithinolytica]